MADADDKKIEEKQEDTKAESTNEKTSSPTRLQELLPWIIMAVVAVLCAGAGLGLGRLFAGSSAPQKAEPSQQAKPTQAENLKVDGSKAGSQKTWYYELDPVVANLNVSGVTRYVRAAITLEITAEMEKEKYTAFLDEEKKPVLTNWLTIYLASLTLDDIRGDRNLRRIQSEILDSFNEKLFPDAKPQIKHILFKEFAIQ
ncbi:MAG: flagellar basal body-associated FliL family protein [Planctomycetota bacterium]